MSHGKEQSRIYISIYLGSEVPPCDNGIVSVLLVSLFFFFNKNGCVHSLAKYAGFCDKPQAFL